jgi:hypothetical protein
MLLASLVPFTIAQVALDGVETKTLAKREFSVVDLVLLRVGTG